MSVAAMLLSSPVPAKARYTEHWMSSAELARTQSHGAAWRERKKDEYKARTPAVATTTDDDPIAAFARGPRSQGNTVRR